MLKATFVALESMMSPRSVAARRGKKVSEILGRKKDDAEGQDAGVEA
jgi:small subunit ribosomal protein S5